MSKSFYDKLKNKKQNEINTKQTTPSVKQPDILPTETWLTSEEAAKFLKISTRTLVTYRNQGFIPYANPGGRMVRYLYEDLHKYLLAHYIIPRNWVGNE